MDNLKRRKIEGEQTTKATAFNVSHFDLTTLPVTDLSILTQEYQQYPPQSKTSDLLEYHLPSDQTHWTCLNNIFLILDLSVRTAAGAKLPSSSTTSVGQLIFSSLFESLDLKLDNITITSGASLHGYCSYFQKTLFTSTENIKRRGPLEGIYMKDKESATDSTGEAYKSLKALAQKDSFQVIGRINHPLFHTPRYLPPGHSLTIRFRLAPNTFYLNGTGLAEGTAFTDKVVINSATLDVKKAVVHSKVNAFYEAALSKNALMSFPIMDTMCSSFIIPKGQISHTSDVLLNSLPNFCAFGLVKSTAYYGSYNECPYHFQDFGLNGYKFSINSDDILFNSPKFSLPNNIIRHYNQLLSIKNDKDEGGIDVNFLEYSKYGYFLMPLFSATNGKNDRFSVGMQGPVRLSLSFSKALEDNVACVFFYHQPKIISFNKSQVFIQSEFNEQ